MSDDRSVSRKFQKAFHGLCLTRCALDVAVCYTGELSYLGRNVHSGIDEGVERFFYLASGVDDCSYLGHAIRARVKTCGLNVEGDHLVVHIPVAAAMHGETAVHIVYKIALTAVDYLNAVLPSGLPHIRKCLKNSVVGHGYGRVSPVRCALNYGSGIC